MEKYENEMEDIEDPSTLQLPLEVTIKEMERDKNEFLDRLSVAASNQQCMRPIQPENLQEDQNLTPKHEEEEQMQKQEKIESLSQSPIALPVVSANIELVTEQQEERAITEAVSEVLGLVQSLKEENVALKKELEEVKLGTAAKLLELQEEFAALKKEMEEMKAPQREALKEVTAQQPRDFVSQTEEANEICVDAGESLHEEKPTLQNEGENRQTEAHKKKKAAGQLKEVIRPPKETLKPQLEQNQSQQQTKKEKKLSRWKRFKKSEFCALLGQCLCCMIIPLLACLT